jgi:hypothetical protein
MIAALLAGLGLFFHDEARYRQDSFSLMAADAPCFSTDIAGISCCATSAEARLGPGACHIDGFGQTLLPAALLLRLQAEADRGAPRARLASRDGTCGSRSTGRGQSGSSGAWTRFARR